MAGLPGDLLEMSKASTSSRRQAPPSWTAALNRARADVAAGRTEDAEAFLRHLDGEDAELPATEQERRRAG